MSYYEDNNGWNWQCNGINPNSVNSNANVGKTTGIIALIASALALLNGGDKCGAINRLIGGGCCNTQAEAEAILAKAKADAELAEYRAREYTDKTTQELFNKIYAENKELSGYLCAERNRITELKGQIETDKAKGEVALLKMQLEQERAFNAYKGETDKRLCALEASVPLVQERCMSAIRAECEKRECADNAIVNYSNGMFVPVRNADVTVGTTSTARIPYNPLPCEHKCA
jgi:hypothetical protein